MKIYPYVGNASLRDNLPPTSHRYHVMQSKALLQWLKETKQPNNIDNSLTVTFIIDFGNKLWINDRHSEHVLCANGEDVLSAGEMTFDVANTPVDIVSITNQSTGYCPEPESFRSVKLALNQTDLKYPLDFTTAYQFRLCKNCGTKNIIKDNWYVCAVCDADLNLKWNF